MKKLFLVLSLVSGALAFAEEQVAVTQEVKEEVAHVQEVEQQEAPAQEVVS